MALNTWWLAAPHQRYWIEFATLEVGAFLRAPKADAGGRANWSYALVSHVQPGDRILHYKTNASGGGAIVGWSTAASAPRTLRRYTWQARGTAGRARGRAVTGPGWEVELDGFHPLAAPVTRSELEKSLDEIVALRRSLEREHGKPVYFPFYLYRRGELRAQQGYLAKFPAELFGLAPGLASAATTEADDHDEVIEDSRPAGSVAPRGRPPRANDPVLRSAIERHAVEMAKEYLAQAQGTDFVDVGKPYDVRYRLHGVERHCEVKGSSLLADTVQLTYREVEHAVGEYPTELIVVDGIKWSRNEDGSIATSGGRLRCWWDWSPAPSALKALDFAYALPPDPE